MVQYCRHVGVSVLNTLKCLHSAMSEDRLVDSGLCGGDCCRLMCVRRMKIKRKYSCTSHEVMWRSGGAAPLIFNLRDR